MFLGELLEEKGRGCVGARADEGEEDPSAILPLLRETGISQGYFGEREGLKGLHSTTNQQR